MNRYFGVEIEACKVKDNYSIPRGWERQWEHCGLEFVSPLLKGQEGLDAITGLYNDIEPEVNRHCGLHVHVDVRDFSDEERLELARRLHADKDIFFGRVDKSRHDNEFCERPLPRVYDYDTWSSYMRRVDTGIYEDRYCWVNFLSVSKHGSVEFRLHEATDNADEVRAWASFLVSYVENVKTGARVSECPACVDQVKIRNLVDQLVS